MTEVKRQGGMLARFKRLPLWVLVSTAGILALSMGGLAAALTLDKGAEAAVADSPSPSAVATPSDPAEPVEAPILGPACEASFAVVGSWDSGWQGEVVISALAALPDWQVSFGVGTAKVSDSWNSTLAAGATGAVTASNLDYNGAVAAGQSTSLGFTATGPVPDDFSAECSSTAAGVPITGDQQEVPVPPFTVVSGVDSPNDDDWLSTDGNRIVNADGKAVWLTGANWFGFNTQERVFHGLYAVKMEDLLDGAAVRGINVIRVPISTQLLIEWRDGKAAPTSAVNSALNPDLADKNTLEIFEAFLGAAKDRGLKVILDVHSAEADNMGHMAPMWWTNKVSAEEFYATWEWVAERYAKDDTIIGFDLKNEPHGTPSDNPRAIWDGSTAANNWRHVAETLAARIQKVHPHALILVEGVEASPKAGKTNASTDSGDYDFNWWGGNLRPAQQFPVRLPVADKLVYSPHDYGPLVHNQPWFQKPFTAQTLRDDVWGPNWLFLHEDNTAPLLIGEWGGRLGQDERQDRWMTALRDLIVSEKLAHTFWCLNPNSGDTGGLLLDDWTTWDSTKYDLLRPALWQDAKGRFVSLDHATPLPGGITVTQYYADGNPAPVG